MSGKGGVKTWNSCKPLNLLELRLTDMAWKCPDRARGLENSRSNRNGEKKWNLQTYLKHSDHDSRYAFKVINGIYGIAYTSRNDWSGTSD